MLTEQGMVRLRRDEPPASNLQLKEMQTNYVQHLRDCIIDSACWDEAKRKVFIIF